MSDDEIDLQYDDFDVEVNNNSEDEDEDEEIKGGKKGKQKKKNKKKNKKSDDEDNMEDVVDMDDNADDIVDMEDVVKNTLYRGIIDPVKYEALESSKLRERIVIPSHMRRTSHRLTLAERTNLIGTRATHISKGAQIYVDIGNLDNPIKIAEKELKERKFPFNIEREINSYEVEYWNPNEMTIDWD